MRLTASVLLLASSTTFSARAAEPPKPDAALAARGAEIAQRVGGSVAFAALHLETGQMTSVNGRAPLALYSVFKLPVAITVLREAAAGRIDLEKKIHVDPSEALLGGSKVNDERWSKAADFTALELLGFSIIHSDNTSVDKLLELLGGPPVVMRTMKTLGFPAVEVKSTVHATRGMKGAYPNVANAEDLARLLAALYQGRLLKDPQRDTLLAFMNDAVTGLTRIRGNLPPGTPVADKTGTGPATSNDVGIVTLPGDRGHLAIAALVTDSKRPSAEQDKAIAEFARAAYDAYVPAQP